MSEKGKDRKHLINKSEYTDPKTIIEFSSEIFKNTSFETTLKIVFDMCKKLTGAKFGHISLLCENGQNKTALFLDAGGLPKYIDTCFLMPKIDLLKQTWQHNKVIYENNLMNSKWAQDLPQGHDELKNILLVPLLIDGNIVGVVALANKEGGFSDSDEELILPFVNICSSVLKNVRTLDLLEENKIKYQTLVSTIPHGIQEIDTSGTITFANEAYHRIYGYEDDEMIGKSMFVLTASEPIRKHLSDYFAVLIKDQPLPVPYYEKSRTKDGKVIDIQVDWNYKRDKEGHLTGFVSVITDISDKKRVEEALKKVHNELERASGTTHQRTSGLKQKIKRRNE